jgi:MoxR-like ATPase
VADVERAAADLVAARSAFVEPLLAEIGRVIVGQERLVNRMLIGLLVNGHVLLEGPPGVAKTLAVRTLAGAIALSFHRLQFTPDLLPADVIGTLVYDPRTTAFSVHKGPIFANLILADEINRAPAKVQSALLEAMQERQVTIGEASHPLADPFLVLATQNPLEHEGTYPLPEAQLDRFLMQVNVDYPSRDEEVEILERHMHGAFPEARPVVQWPDIAAARDAVEQVRLEPSLRGYVLDIVRATRGAGNAGGGGAGSGTAATGRTGTAAAAIRFGASPRAAVHLALAARAHAFLARRAFVLPEDVKVEAPDVLRHRVLLHWEAEAEGATPDGVIGQLLTSVRIP